MPLTKIRSAKRTGFRRATLYRHKELSVSALQFLKHKSSFFVASLSLVAFLAGNMVGEHGWYAFWKSVMGATDDRLIIYTGTVPPIALVPDYSKWSMYGGNAEQHTFRQVPKDLLVPLPAYNQKREKLGYEGADVGDVYSVGNMGSYETGAEGQGSHVGIDIRVPEGTSVRSIASGIVEQVREDVGGYGKLIVIRHPNVPDPAQPKVATVLHSVYGHLSAQFVSEGDIVLKGQEIGLSGQTGFATGPHLHFQIDRDEAPWHPYWPFTTSEAREAGWSFTQAINKGLHAERGYEYTIHPMLYVQSNYPAPTQAVAQVQKSSAGTKGTMNTAVKPTKTSNLVSLRESRLQERLARNTTKPAIVVQTQNVVTAQDIPAAPATVTVNTPKPAAPAAPVVVTPAAPSSVTVEIQHDRTFSGREWETVRFTLVDSSGRKLDSSALQQSLYLRLAYGEAEFEKDILTALDFEDGVAEVKMLPRGRRTVVIMVEPLKVMSLPMQFSDDE